MDILREDLGYIFRIKAYLQKRPKLLYALLLLFGIWAAYYIVSPWDYLSQEQINNITNIYMNSRLYRLNQCIQQILAGNQPQVMDHNPSFYFYASYLGVMLGKTEAWQVFLFLQSGAAVFALLLYPTLIYKLTNTILPALASPFFLNTFIGWTIYKCKTDSYWSMAWIVVIGLPLLGIFFREKCGWIKWVAFAGICLCMGLGNLPRMHSSLGIFLLLMTGLVKEYVIPLKKKRSQKAVFQVCTLLILVLVSYTLFTGLIPKLYLATTGQDGKIEAFGPWHTIYAGLGWEENEYGFQFNDGYVDEQAKKIDPSVVYCSPEYMDILKDEWFRLWREDPGYMLGTYYRKLMACLNLCLRYPDYADYDGGHYLKIFLLAVCILRYVCKRRKILASWGPLLLSALFCCLFGIVFPMIAIPYIFYIMSSFAANGMLFVFAALAIMQGIIDAAEEFSRRDSIKLTEKGA